MSYSRTRSAKASQASRTALQVSTSGLGGGVKVYNCSAGKTLPQWFDEAKKKKTSLRYNAEFRQRIELVQDFSFPTASTRVRMTPDGRHILATGTYPPQLKVFELDQLGLKFERHLDSEAVQISTLGGQDWRKMAVLRDDRTVEIHAQFGLYHKARIPRFGRDMVYDEATCDLVLGASSSEVYRLNLDQGRFLSPYKTGLAGGVNSVAVNPRHGLVALGGENVDQRPEAGGAVEFWDPRDRTRAAVLEQASAGVTVAAFDREDALSFACGLHDGRVMLYDMRSSRPLVTKDHRQDLPIRSVQFLGTGGVSGGERRVMSADRTGIRVWDRANGAPFFSVEPEGGTNEAVVLAESGLVMAAAEAHRIQVFFVPQLGPAPAWCSFLDSLTEELEEKAAPTLYDDYKFVTRAELEQWGLEHLIGSNLLRAYMHGFFMDVRLYNSLKEAAEPEQYEERVRQQVERKIEERRGSRIRTQRQLPNVNKMYAKVLLEQPRLQRQVRDEEEKGASAEKVFQNPLGDDRFKGMFTSSDFEIDTTSDAYRRLHPSGASKRARRAMEQDDGDDSGGASDDDMVHGERAAGGGRVLDAMREVEERQRALELRRERGAANDSDDDFDEEARGRDDGGIIQRKAKRRKQPAMRSMQAGYNVKHLLKDTARDDRRERKELKRLTLAERLAQNDKRARDRKAAAEAEARGAAAAGEAGSGGGDGGEDGGGDRRRRDRRGMSDLIGRDSDVRIRGGYRPKRGRR